MTEPNPMAEAISTLQEALTCKSCERRPRKTEGGSSDSTNAKYYNGPLLASFECGCMFCRDCHASCANNFNESVDNRDCHDVSMFKCPVCRLICNQTPRPLLPWLANENMALPISINSDSVDSEMFDRLSVFLSIACPVERTVKNDETIDVHSQTYESEVPGTCLPLYRDAKQSCQTDAVQTYEFTEQQFDDESNQLEMQCQTEEVPGTCLSFIDKHRIRTDRGQHNDSQVYQDESDISYSDVCEQTETIPGTCISFLDKQRKLQQYAVGACDETQVFGTHVSFYERHRAKTTNPHEHHDDLAESQTTYAGEQTEEVQGTCLSYLDRRRIQSKRRRVTTSPMKVTDKPMHVLSTEADADNEKPTERVRECGRSATDTPLFITADILDPIEANALELLNRQGHCIVVNGVYNISNDDSPRLLFPNVFVTHAIDGSESNRECFRSYQYLKAVALGARVIDAKWLVDSRRVGELLDCDSYTIGNDLRPQSFKPRLPLLKGLQFGIVGDRDSSAFKAENGLPSQLKLQTKPMTTQQISELVACCGGTCTTDTFTETCNAILVPSGKSLECIINEMRTFLKTKRWRGIDKLSIDKYHGRRAISDAAQQLNHSGRELHLPFVRDKWLEDCICAQRSLDLTSKYCCGILRMQYSAVYNENY